MEISVKDFCGKLGLPEYLVLGFVSHLSVEVETKFEVSKLASGLEKFCGLKTDLALFGESVEQSAEKESEVILSSGVEVSSFVTSAPEDLRSQKKK